MVSKIKAFFKKEDKVLTKTELLENNWVEFLEWVQDSRTHVGVSPPYDYYNEPINGRSHHSPLINEHNFWLWYQDFKNVVA